MAEQSRVGPRPESDAFRDSSRSSAEDNVNYAHCDDLTQKQAWCLYLSHFLSMWNSRMYEWAVVKIPCSKDDCPCPTAPLLTDGSDSFHPSRLSRESLGFVDQVSVPSQQSHLSDL